MHNCSSVYFNDYSANDCADFFSWIESKNHDKMLNLIKISFILF
jgi:hypothetical protein